MCMSACDVVCGPPQFDKYQLTYYEDAGPPYDQMEMLYANSFQARGWPRAARASARVSATAVLISPSPVGD